MAYAETSVSGLPLAPNQGRSLTAAEMILLGPRAERSAVKKLSRFAASDGEYGWLSPAWSGYSFVH